jgi:hypothetical protein
MHTGVSGKAGQQLGVGPSRRAKLVGNSDEQ